MNVKFRFQVAAAMTLLFLGNLAGAATYVTTLLGDNSVALAINNSGAIAGQFNQHATVWSGSKITDLGYGAATAINDTGQVAGYSNYHQATVWNGKSAMNLGTNSWAFGINNSGQVVGWWQAPSSTGHGAMWDGSTFMDLGLLGVPDGNAPLRDSSASDINNSGQIVGHSSTILASGGYGMHATIWNGGKATDLGTLVGWEGSFATGINDKGQVSGYSYIFGSQHATLWSGNTSIDLGTLGGKHSRASNINNRGQIVGYSTISGDLEGPHHATIWNGIEPTDLNSYIDVGKAAAGWVLSEATGINEAGSVVGSAFNTITSERRAFLLTVSAIPEPKAFALMLIGVCLIAGVRHVSSTYPRPPP